VTLNGVNPRATCYNSLLYWFPAVERAGIPHPRTKIVWVGWKNLCAVLDDKPLPENVCRDIVAAVEDIGYPLFMRTDLHSAKHDFADTCYVADASVLLAHIGALIEADNMMCFLGDDSQALVFREFLDLESTFMAFRDMPVARERRVFVIEGKAICSHPYWPKGALYKQRKALPPDWRTQLRNLSLLRQGDGVRLRQYAEMVGHLVPGAWSIDFAWVPVRGDWYLIDMALAKHSWHPSCGRKQELIEAALGRKA